jgi:hypothetical protein
MTTPGPELQWKIECDALIWDDWQGLAWILAQRLPRFSRVVGVAGDGLRLAEALRLHAVTATNTVVVADNVLMTGASMEGARTKIATDERWTGRILGAVAFARTRPPPWIRAAFVLG